MNVGVDELMNVDVRFAFSLQEKNNKERPFALAKQSLKG